MKPNIQTFLGCDATYEHARIVLFGAPLDATASFRPGARFGPAAIRGESFGLETYSPYQDKDLAGSRVFDGGDLELPFGNPARALDMIEAQTAAVLNDEKIPLMLGGEHLATLGAVRAAVQKHPALCILHFDAHADLRNEYLDETLSHATVMRRCHELLGDGRIFQFGIRSGDRSEFLFAEDHVRLQKFDFAGLEEVCRTLSGKPVYLSLDLDVLDPAAFPGTGTPEAGGVTFAELHAALSKATTLHIVGLDVTELCPVYDQSGASTALACKMVRELLIALG